MNGIYERGLTNLNVDHENAYAKFVDKNIIEADGKQYTAPNILIAVGGFPYVPDIPVECA